MIARIFVCTLLCTAAVSSAADPPAPAPAAPPTQPAKTWLDDVPALRIGSKQAFQFREDIDVASDQLVAYVSYAPPDKVCVILCDRVDGTPVVISNQQRIWLLDLIGGQVVRMEGAAEVVATVTNNVVRTSWGVRTEFPNDASRLTVDTDFGMFMKAVAPPDQLKLTVDSSKRRVATFKNPTLTVSLTASPNDPPAPVAFNFISESTTQPLSLRFDSFVLNAAPPAWHRALDEAALAKRIPVIDAENPDKLPIKTQVKLVKFKSVLNSRGLFILRTALRDNALREQVEKNSRLRIDFDEVSENSKKLTPQWLAALAEQGIKMPKATPTTRPVAPKQ
jgi:hypothetical protein